MRRVPSPARREKRNGSKNRNFEFQIKNEKLKNAREFLIFHLKSEIRNFFLPLNARRCIFVLCFLAACRSPTEPRSMPLAAGRWTGDGACLSVTDTACDLAVGCGHGQFPRPNIQSDGTFEVDGTYRVEVGPVAINPPPPAHFSGAVTGSTLTLHVVPSGSRPPAMYSMRAGAPGNCPVPCV